MAAVEKIAPAIWDKSPSSIFIYDLKGHFQYTNKTAYEERGYTRQEFMSLCHQDLCPLEYVPVYNGYFKELKKKGNVTFESMHGRKDGTSYPVEINASIITIDGKQYVLGVCRDITEHKKNTDKLRWLGQITEQVTDSIIVTNTDLEIIYINKATSILFGYSLEELLGKTPLLLNVEQLAPELQEQIYKTASSGKTYIGQFTNQRKDGSTFICEFKVTPMYSTDGCITGYIGIQRDITERLMAEVKLKQSDECYQALFNRSNDFVFLVDLSGNFIDMNKAALDRLGYTKDEISSLSMSSLLDNVQLSYASEVMKEIIETGTQKKLAEYKVRAKNGEIVFIELKGSLICRQGKPYAIQGIARDITERKRGEEELQLKANLLDNATDSIFLHNFFDGKILYVNETACRALGYTRDELIGKSIHNIDTAEHLDIHNAKLRTMAENGCIMFETAHRHKNGALIPVEVKGRIIESGGREFILGVVRDTIERKKAEEELRESENKYRVLTENSLTGIFIVQDEKFMYVNDKFAKMHGYEPEELLGKEHLMLIPPGDKEIVRNRVAKRYKGESVSLMFTGQRLKKDGSIIWTQQIMAIIEYHGRPAIMGNIVDITEVKEATDKRLTALKSTIEAIALTTEIRDPYTAGHQHRVAELACAIAKKMNLPRDQIEGIRLIGIVHDIGKMYVPAEILSKPGQLNELEFDMIKLHAKAGYDILKTIESPWPLAQAVLQHHLRLDGSGYPDCERGKEIIIEARIVAVADVVEAMASHRPYRPSLGIDKALDEITQNKGKLYDIDVVDACLKLFNEKGFKFE